MRMRNKPFLEKRLGECGAIIISEPKNHKGIWLELLKGACGVRLEIGCGKGKFINQIAKENPKVLHIALEKEANALVIAAEQTKQLGLDNLVYIVDYADLLLEYFAPNELDLIYLNFSDPWPKKRQAKRRLTHAGFLSMYMQALKPGGYIRFKTDNRDLFDFSLESFKENGFEIREVTYDLHKTDMVHATTEYEDKFAALGMPICFAKAKRVDN